MYSAEHFTIADNLFDAVVLSSSNDSTPTATHASSLAEEERRGHSSAEESVNHAVLELDDAASPATTNMGSDDGEESTTISSASFRDRKQRSTRPSAAIFDYLTRTTNSFSWLGVKSFHDQRVEDHFIAYMWCSRVKLLWGCMTVLCICLMFPFINGEIGTWSQYVYFSGALFCIALMILDAGSQKLRIRKERDDDEILRRIVDDGTAIAEQIETHTRIQREHHENFIKRCKTYEQLCFILMLSLGAIFLLTQYHHLKICAEKQFPDEKLTECYRATSSMYWGYVTLFRTLVHRTKLGIIILVVSVIEFLLGRVISPPVADSDRELWPKLIMIITYGASFLILQTFRERNSRRFFLLELSIVQSGRLAMLEKERIRTVVATMLPREVLHRVGGPRGSQRKADVRESASILQFDVVNFTRWCSSRDSAAVVQMVSRLVTRFDAEALLVGAHKLKTIGDAYQATTGLLGTHWSDGGSSAVGLFFLANRMHSVMQTSEFPEWTGRIGIATGQLMGTIVGSAPYRYDVFGEAAERVAQLEPDSAPEHTLLCAASDAQVVSVFPELGLRGERVHNGEELVGRMYGLCSDFCGDQQTNRTNEEQTLADLASLAGKNADDLEEYNLDDDAASAASTNSASLSFERPSPLTPAVEILAPVHEGEQQTVHEQSKSNRPDPLTAVAEIREKSTNSRSTNSGGPPSLSRPAVDSKFSDDSPLSSGLPGYSFQSHNERQPSSSSSFADQKSPSKASFGGSPSLMTSGTIPAFDPTVNTDSDGGIAKLLCGVNPNANLSLYNLHRTSSARSSRANSRTNSRHDSCEPLEDLDSGGDDDGPPSSNDLVISHSVGASAVPPLMVVTASSPRQQDSNQRQSKSTEENSNSSDDDENFDFFDPKTKKKESKLRRKRKKVTKNAMKTSLTGAKSSGTGVSTAHRNILRDAILEHTDDILNDDSVLPTPRARRATLLFTSTNSNRETNTIISPAGMIEAMSALRRRQSAGAGAGAGVGVGGPEEQPPALPIFQQHHQPQSSLLQESGTNNHQPERAVSAIDDDDFDTHSTGKKESTDRRSSAQVVEQVAHAEVHNISISPEEALEFQIQVGYGAGLFAFFMVFAFYISCLTAMGWEGLLLSHINLTYAIVLCSALTIIPIIVTHHEKRLSPYTNIAIVAVTETIFHVACGYHQGSLVSNTVAYSSTIFGVLLLYVSSGVKLNIQQVITVVQTILQIFWQVYFYQAFIGSLVYITLLGIVFLATNHFVAQEYHFHCLQSKRAAKSVELAEAEAEALEGVLMAIMPQHVVPDLLQRFHENSFAPIIQDLEGVGIGFFRIQRTFKNDTGDATPRTAALERAKSAGVDAIRGIRRILFVVESVMPEFEYLMVVKTIGNVLMVGSCLSAEQQKHREDGLAQLLELPSRLVELLEDDNNDEDNSESGNGTDDTLSGSDRNLEDREDSESSFSTATSSSASTSAVPVGHSSNGSVRKTLLNRGQHHQIHLCEQPQRGVPNQRQQRRMKKLTDNHVYANTLSSSSAADHRRRPQLITTLHCGVHYGKAATAVMGINQLNYDVYGTTVNGASRVLSVGCRNAQSDKSTVAATDLVITTIRRNAATSDSSTQRKSQTQRQNPLAVPSKIRQQLESDGLPSPPAKSAENRYDWSEPFLIVAKGLGEVNVRTATINNDAGSSAVYSSGDW